VSFSLSSVSRFPLIDRLIRRVLRSRSLQRTAHRSTRRAPVTAESRRKQPSSGSRCWANEMTCMMRSDEGKASSRGRTRGGLALVAGFVVIQFHLTAWFRIFVSVRTRGGRSELPGAHHSDRLCVPGNRRRSRDRRLGLTGLRCHRTWAGSVDSEVGRTHGELWETTSKTRGRTTFVPAPRRCRERCCSNSGLPRQEARSELLRPHAWFRESFRCR
jgi:hypothetical protein